MWSNIAIRKRVAGWGRAIGQQLRRLTKPNPSMATAVTGAVVDVTRTKLELVAQNTLLRQQLIVLRRSVDRPRIKDSDRLLMVLLARLDSAWRQALHIIKPDTLLRWHRRLFKLLWRRKSTPRGQPRRLSKETIDLIKKMASTNLTWGAERIRGELLKLGIRVSKRTIQKYIRQVRPPGNHGQTWDTFIRNHTNDIWACDFLQLYDALFRPIFAFFVVKHGSREVAHFNVTRSPSDAWTAQQLREATPLGKGPKYLIRDNDDKYGSKFAAIAEGTGIEVVKIPPRSPNLNPICERFLKSVRHECLDHIVILNEQHLRRVTKEHVSYFNASRPHQGINQHIPDKHNDEHPSSSNGTVVAIPILGGLHHDYRRAA